MTMKGARRIFRKTLHGYPISFRRWAREAVVSNPGLLIGTFGKLGRIVRGPTKAAGTLVR